MDICICSIGMVFDCLYRDQFFSTSSFSIYMCVWIICALNYIKNVFFCDISKVRLPLSHLIFEFLRLDITCPIHLDYCWLLCLPSKCMLMAYVLSWSSASSSYSAASSSRSYRGEGKKSWAWGVSSRSVKFTLAHSGVQGENSGVPYSSGTHSIKVWSPSLEVKKVSSTVYPCLQKLVPGL